MGLCFREEEGERELYGNLVGSVQDAVVHY